MTDRGIPPPPAPHEAEVIEADAEQLFERTRDEQRKPGEVWPDWSQLTEETKGLYRAAAANPYGLPGYQARRW